MTLNPLVFVAMPFGVKESDRNSIDFDSIYNGAIKPAVAEQESSIDIIRADEETIGGFIHGPMYERLLLSEIVIADLTLANSNVFYELGIRHCARPKSTILIFSSDTRLPFDVKPLRAIPYDLEKGKLTEKSAKILKNNINKRLIESAKEETPDSPLFQLIQSFPGIQLKPEQTESFRKRLFHIESIHDNLNSLRNSSNEESVGEVRGVEKNIGDFSAASYELLIDLLLTYRDIQSWDDMIRIIGLYPPSIKESIIVQEQLALALNRRNAGNDRERAIEILNSIVDNYGNSSETLGILGRVYKDKYLEAKKYGKTRQARGALRKAIETYYTGFEEDPRDYYPGINALTLLFIENDDKHMIEFKKLKPLVEFALERHGGKSSDNYWVLATVLEFYSLCQDWNSANEVADKISMEEYSAMKINTTINNLNFIVDKLKEFGQNTEELEQIINDLRKP
jgi:tetratricopeptide (TPR) repeat protein